MENKYNSYKLTEFNLVDQINLGLKCGLLKMLRAKDGTLVLIEDSSFGLIDQVDPTPSRCCGVDALLGFVLDIGIRKEKRLTVDTGFYFGLPLIDSQSTKRVQQSDYDASLMEDLDSIIQANYQSGDSEKEALAVKAAHLIHTYNDARLLYPNFYSDSYLSLMRILDALFNAYRAIEFATAAAKISHDFNVSLYTKIAAMPGYSERLVAAEAVFSDCVTEEGKRKKDSCISDMSSFDKNDKFVFSCFYSAYQYRNKFVHWGLPFPDIVKESLGLETDAGTAYIHPSLGISSIKIYRPGGLQDQDLLDMHCIVQDPAEVKMFQDRYFKIIPTVHFLKSLVRIALKEAILAMK